MFEYDFNKIGHICIYGGTGSGKTVYMKYIINQMIESEYCKIDDIFVFCTNPTQFSEYTCYTEWNEIHKLKKKRMALPPTENKKPHPTVIVLDDFNGEINTISDEDYINLFTQGRQFGFKVLTVAHTPKSIGPKARECIVYAITGFSSNVDYIKDLAKNYLMNDFDKLSDKIKEAAADSEYTMVVIDKKTMKLYLDTAPNPNPPKKKKINIDNILDSYNKPVGSMNSNDGHINNGVNRPTTNNGLYNDNSTINIQNNIEIKQLYQQHQYNKLISIDNFHHDQKMRKMHDKIDCKELCLKLFKTKEELSREIDLLNRFCGVSCVQPSNIEKWAKVFMSHYYPNITYNPDNLVRTTTNNYHLVEEASRLLNGDINGNSLIAAYTSSLINKKMLTCLGL